MTSSGFTGGLFRLLPEVERCYPQTTDTNGPAVSPSESEGMRQCFTCSPHQAETKGSLWPASYSQTRESIHTSYSKSDQTLALETPLHFQETISKSEMFYSAFFLFLSFYKRNIKIYSELSVVSIFASSILEWKKLTPCIRIQTPLLPCPSHPDSCNSLPFFFLPSSCPFSYTLHESVHILPLFQSVDIKCNGIRCNQKF